MSKFIGVSLYYDAESRQLKANLSAYGFVPALPDTIITSEYIKTVTLMQRPVLMPTDLAAITTALTTAMSDANVQIHQWAMAALLKEKADLLPVPPVNPDPPIPPVPDPTVCCELPFDPTALFDQELNDPTP